MINDTFNFGRKRQIPTTTIIIYMYPCVVLNTDKLVNYFDEAEEFCHD